MKSISVSLQKRGCIERDIKYNYRVYDLFQFHRRISFQSRRGQKPATYQSRILPRVLACNVMTDYNDRLHARHRQVATRIHLRWFVSSSFFP